MLIGGDKPFQILSRLDSSEVEEVFALYFKRLFHFGYTLRLGAGMKAFGVSAAGHYTYLFLMLRKIFYYLRL